MTVRSRPFPWLRAQEEDGNADVTLLCSNEFVRAAAKRQILLTDAIYPEPAPLFEEMESILFRAGKPSRHAELYPLDLSRQDHISNSTLSVGQ